MCKKVKIVLGISLLSLLLNACQSVANHKWQQITLSHQYDEIAFDNVNTKLWLLERSTNLVGIDVKNDSTYSLGVPEIIDTPIDSGIGALKMCASQDVWVIAKNGMLFSYDHDKHIWEEKKLTNLNNIRSCEPLGEQSIGITADENSIAIIEKDTIRILEDAPGQLHDMGQDYAGRLWITITDVSTYKEKVYQYGDNKTWVERGSEKGARLFDIDKDSIWLAGSPQVTLYEWPLENNEIQSEPIVQFKITSGVLVDFFMDANGNKWLITSKAIFVMDASNNEFRNIDLPWGTGYVSDALVDKKNCVLFILTNNGVYYYNYKRQYCSKK